LLHHDRIPGQVEQHQPAAEFKIAPFAAALGGDHQGEAVAHAKLGDFDIPLARRQVFVKYADADSPDRFQRLLQGDEGFPVGHEHQRLLAGLLPLLGLGGEPPCPGVVRAGLRAGRAQIPVQVGEHRRQGRRGGQRPAHAVGLAPQSAGPGGDAALRLHQLIQSGPAGRVVHGHRQMAARRKSTDISAAR